MESTFLKDICARRREQLARELASVSREEMRERALAAPAAPSFWDALRQPGISFICEAKKASPSKGLLCPDFRPADLAEIYASSGAAAISCLTEEAYFQGSSRYLRAIAERVDIPILRKDFILDTYQIDEAKAIGASAVLLIAAMLSDAELAGFLDHAHALGLDCLVEVHNAGEMERAQKQRPRILGINNRDLHTFHVDLETTKKLAACRIEGQLLVSESGLHTREDVAFAESCGADAVLIGEVLVRSGDIPGTLRKLRGDRP